LQIRELAFEETLGRRKRKKKIIQTRKVPQIFKQDRKNDAQNIQRRIQSKHAQRQAPLKPIAIVKASRSLFRFID
jgi:hypothetical protein